MWVNSLCTADYQSQNQTMCFSNNRLFKWAYTSKKTLKCHKRSIEKVLELWKQQKDSWESKGKLNQ